MFKTAEIHFLTMRVSSLYEAEHKLFIMFLLDSIIVLNKVQYLLDRSFLF